MNPADMNKIRELIRRGLADPADAIAALRRLDSIMQIGELPSGAVPARTDSQCPPWIDNLNHPAGVASVLQPELAPDQYLTVRDVSAVAAGDESVVYRMEFNGMAGMLIGVRGSVVYLDTDQDTCEWLPCYDRVMELQLSLNGKENLITDGEAPSWIRFADLFADPQEWAALARRIDTTDVIRCRFRNQLSDGGVSLIPSLVFKFRCVPEWANQAGRQAYDG